MQTSQQKYLTLKDCIYLSDFSIRKDKLYLLFHYTLPKISWHKSKADKAKFLRIFKS